MTETKKKTTATKKTTTTKKPTAKTTKTATAKKTVAKKTAVTKTATTKTAAAKKTTATKSTPKKAEVKTEVKTVIEKTPTVKTTVGKKQQASKKNQKEMAFKIGTSLFALVLFIVLWACFAGGNIITFYNNDDKLASFSLEIADTDKTRETGLMHRDSLDQDNGMLFVYDSEQYVSMWMKNTKIPLDMIFIGKDNQVKCIRKNAMPGSLIPQACFAPVVYVLEINGGLADKHGIKKGSTVKIRR